MISQLLDFLFGQPSEFIPVVYTTPFADKFQYFFVADMRSEQRNNHPLCEFEWTDKESGLRFYDDPLEGMVNIPDNAPPRPGAGAEWNVLSGKWGEL